MKIKSRVIRVGVETALREIEEWAQELDGKGAVDKTARMYLERGIAGVKEACKFMQEVEEKRKRG